MNKYLMVAGIFLYFIILTLLMNSLSLSVSGNVTDGIIAPEMGGTLTTLFSLLKSFWRLLSFRLEGIPIIISLIFVYPPMLILFYMLIEIIKDIIPFT